MNQQIERIQVEYSADSLDDSDTITRQMAIEYGDSLAEAIEAEYPEAEVEVEMTISNTVRVIANNIRLEEQTQREVGEIVGDHWQQWLETLAADADNGEYACPFCGERYVNHHWTADAGETQLTTCDGEDGCGREFLVRFGA